MIYYSTNSWERFWYNYQFESGVDYSEELGRPTTTNITPRNTQTENIRRNKDVTAVPPPYGVFSGEIDTEQSNPYVTPDNPPSIRETTDFTITSTQYDTANAGINAIDTGTLTPTSLDYTGNSSSPGSTVTISTNEINTEPMYYSDGSIGTLKVPALGLSVKVYEGESLDNLKKGIGHFEFTSVWDGNVALAAHNGGSAGYFEELKNLKTGTEFIYETKYGTRTYALSYKETISDTDYSLLGWSNENILTMITCVSGQPNKRLAVIATEK